MHDNIRIIHITYNSLHDFRIRLSRIFILYLANIQYITIYVHRYVDSTNKNPQYIQRNYWYILWTNVNHYTAYVRSNQFVYDIHKRLSWMIFLIYVHIEYYVHEYIGFSYKNTQDILSLFS